MNDLGVTITSSPFFNFNDLIAISKATLPFETATEYLFPKYKENSLSNFLIYFPVQ